MDQLISLKSKTAFMKIRYWLCAATGPSIKIWDLETKAPVDELRPEVAGTARSDPPQCLSLAWSADGQTLFAGYSDKVIRVWQVRVSTLSNWVQINVLLYFF